jgi:hypothetical protein
MKGRKSFFSSVGFIQPTASTAWPNHRISVIFTSTRPSPIHTPLNRCHLLSLITWHLKFYKIVHISWQAHSYLTYSYAPFFIWLSHGLTYWVSSSAVLYVHSLLSLTNKPCLLRVWFLLYAPPPCCPSMELAPASCSLSRHCARLPAHQAQPPWPSALPAMTPPVFGPSRSPSTVLRQRSSHGVPTRTPPLGFRQGSCCSLALLPAPRPWLLCWPRGRLLLPARRAPCAGRIPLLGHGCHIVGRGFLSLLHLPVRGSAPLLATARRTLAPSPFPARPPVLLFFACAQLPVRRCPPSPTPSGPRFLQFGQTGHRSLLQFVVESPARCLCHRNFPSCALLCPDHQPTIPVFSPLKNSRRTLRPRRVREAVVELLSFFFASCAHHAAAFVFLASPNVRSRSSSPVRPCRRASSQP